MDYIGNITQIDNISLAGETVTFIYKIIPINQVFGTNNFTSEIKSALSKIITTVFKPGAIYLIPKKLDMMDKIHKMDQLHNQYSDGLLEDPYQQFRTETIEHITTEVVYESDIFLTFVTNRGALKYKKIVSRMNEALFNNPPIINKDYEQKLLDTSNYIKNIIEQYFKTDMLSDEEIYYFYNNMVRPIFKSRVEREYYINPENIEHLEYIYTESERKDRYYTKHFAIENINVNVDYSNMLSGLGLKKHPVFVCIKFDPNPSEEALKAAESQSDELQEEQKKYKQNFGRESRQYKDSFQKSKLAMLVFDDPDEIEMLTQITIRVEASQEEELNRRVDEVKRHIEGTYKMKISKGGAGKQHDMMLNLLPFINKYQPKTTILNLNLASFVELNPFIGMKIGMEYGVPLTMTHGKEVPVFYDSIMPFKNETLHAQPGIAIVGESGGGKSELVKQTLFELMLVFNMPTFMFDPKGEPDQIDKIPWLKPYFQNIVLGNSQETIGVLDPIFRFKDDCIRAKEQAKLDIRYILSSLSFEYKDPFIIDEAIDKVFLDYHAKKIQRPTLNEVITKLLELEDRSEGYLMGRNLKHASTLSLCNLFFATDKTIERIETKDMKFTRIQFKGMPRIKKIDSNNLTHIFSGYILGRCHSLAEEFIYTDGYGVVVYEEYERLKQTPQGEESTNMAVTTCRAMKKIPMIVTQNLTHLGDNKETILNNAGMLFIGNINSKSEIDFIINELELSDNKSIQAKLRKKGEHASLSDKYVFLMSDHNERKAFIRSKPYKMFSRYFDTSGNKEEIEESIL